MGASGRRPGRASSFPRRARDWAPWWENEMSEYSRMVRDVSDWVTEAGASMVVGEAVDGRLHPLYTELTARGRPRRDECHD